MKKFYFIFFTILTISSISCIESKNEKQYTMETVYETETDSFISTDGNMWGYEGNYENGKQYTFLMSDNGTENNVEDDTMISLLQR